MEESSLLIVGANGQLGKALQVKYPHAKAVDRSKLDITNWQQIQNFDWNGIEIIINVAAYTKVDGAETDEGKVLAEQVNAEGAANLAKIAMEKDLTLVHISTEYVFDGTKENHKEDEPFSPLSVYGSTKAAGDDAVSKVPKHYIVRTSWVIGEGKNFVLIMLGLGQKGVDPSVIADNTGRPTFASELARAIDYIITNNLPFGTYNVSNGGDAINWADFTRAIFKEAGLKNRVTDVTTKDYYKDKPNAASRPLHSTLNLDKIMAAGFVPKDWHEDLAQYVKKELEK